MGGSGGALEGIRVLDLTSYAAGPYCAMLLGDLGADVVKVEPPAGEHSRVWGKWSRDNKSLLFHAVNRNKRSVVVDLKTDEGKADFARLVATSDIVIEAFAPGVADKLGAGYDVLRAVNERLVYCSISGFGDDGPLRNLSGFDTMLQAATGIMSYTGEIGGGPVRIAVSAIDTMTGALAFGAILAALRERDISGVGQRIEATLFDTAMNLHLWAIPQWSATGEEPQRWGGQYENSFPRGIYAAADGHLYVGVAHDQHWIRFCGALGLDELLDDERFTTNVGRITHRDVLGAILQPVFDARKVTELTDALDAARVPASKVRSVGEAVQLEHTRVRGSVRAIPGEPDVLVAATPFRMERGLRDEWLAPPDLGADTEELLG